MDRLPLELWTQVFEYAITQHSIPANMLCASAQLYDLCLPILYRDIRLVHPLSLELFARNGLSLPHAFQCRSFYLRCTSKNVDGRSLMDVLAKAFERCPNILEVELCIHSYHSELPGRVSNALIKVNPRVFKWTSPDPDHHFSTAIIPFAVLEVASVIKVWTQLRHLHLSSVAFGSFGSVFSTDEDYGILFARDSIAWKRSLGAELWERRISHPTAANAGVELLSDDEWCNTSRFQNNLRTVHINQATFLSAQTIVLLAIGLPHVESIRLVDVYKGSIWGPRLRDEDIRLEVERMLSRNLLDLEQDEAGGIKINLVKTRGEADEVLNKVSRVVRLGIRLQRIEGGDRG